MFALVFTGNGLHFMIFNSIDSPWKTDIDVTLLVLHFFSTFKENKPSRKRLISLNSYQEAWVQLQNTETMKAQYCFSYKMEIAPRMSKNKNFSLTSKKGMKKSKPGASVSQINDGPW